MTFRVEPTTDPALAERIERAMGWPRTLPEISRRYQVARGFVARAPDGEPVGAATVAVHEGADDRRALAWVGGMGVLPAWRGRGVARMLLDACLQEAGDARVVGLDATDAGRPLYARAGFRPVSTSTRWRRAGGEARAVASPRHSVHPISLSEAMEIAAYDLDRFGAKRLRWLLAALHDFPWTAFMSRDRRTGDVTGFVLATERLVGPWVADDADAAAALLAACELAGAPPAALVPDAHADAHAVLRAAGWSPDEAARTTRMLRGDARLPGRPETVFAYAAWALG